MLGANSHAGIDQDALLRQLLHVHGLASGEPMALADGQRQLLLEQRPRVEPVPGLPERAGDGEIGLALLEALADLGGRPAQDLEVQAAARALHLGQAVRQRRLSMVCDSASEQRLRRALLERGGQRLGGKRALVALLHQRQHALAEIGQVRVLALAPQQLAAELILELLDGARQGGLGDVALLGRAREIQRRARPPGNSGSDAFPSRHETPSNSAARGRRRSTH